MRGGLFCSIFQVLIFLKNNDLLTYANVVGVFVYYVYDNITYMLYYQFRSDLQVLSTYQEDLKVKRKTLMNGIMSASNLVDGSIIKEQQSLIQK